MGENAAASRILLSLRQHQNGRKTVGLGSLIRRYGHPALRHSCLSRSTSWIPESRDLARAIFNRVDWTWLSMDTRLLPHGWMPENGFLPYRWDYYSELMMMYLLGLGSSSHPSAAGNLGRLEAHDLRL